MNEPMAAMRISRRAVVPSSNSGGGEVPGFDMGAEMKGKKEIRAIASIEFLISNASV